MPPRRFIQARLVDHRADPPVLLPEPTSSLLIDPRAGDDEPPHAIEASAVSELGVRLETRHLLGRGSDGRPHLWLERRRFVRPRATARGFGFDLLVPELPPASRAPALSELAVSIAGIAPVRNGNGVAEHMVTVRIEHAGDRPVLALSLVVEQGRTPIWSPAVHAPVELARLLPGETVELAVPVVLVDEPVTADLRVRLFAADRPAAPLVAIRPVDWTPPAPSALLVVAAPSPIEIDGALARTRVQVRSPRSAVDLGDVELQIQGAGEDGWQRVEGWRPADAPPADADRGVVSARATWNLARYPGSVRVRARRPIDGSDAVVSAPLELTAPGGAAASSPRLAIGVSIREVRPASLLAVLLVDNAGTDDLTDLRLSFHQRAPDRFEWSPVTHERAAGELRVPRGERIAVPLLIERRTAAGPTLLRARAYSIRWALSDSAFVLR